MLLTFCRVPASDARSNAATPSRAAANWYYSICRVSSHIKHDSTPDHSSARHCSPDRASPNHGPAHHAATHCCPAQGCPTHCAPANRSTARHRSV